MIDLMVGFLALLIQLLVKVDAIVILDSSGRKMEELVFLQLTALRMHSSVLKEIVYAIMAYILTLTHANKSQHALPTHCGINQDFNVCAREVVKI